MASSAEQREDAGMRTLWAKDEGKVDSATCPDCKRLLKYGPGGLINLEKTHRGKQVCRELKPSASTDQLFPF
ncbi:hypothetical protein DFH07DRAFT_1064725 [Mycena maculata]|uniref:Uncharacterized protein n=1 Tax=Mycena maculata TaxID=230809 RepID=A0AAD7IA81_9AGAR|nr:hypothetical protein DFH07DRAFT_1064725 [Mycena maculata]